MYLQAIANQADEVPHHWRHQSHPILSNPIEIGRIRAINTTHLCICLRGRPVRRKHVSPEVHKRQHRYRYRYICIYRHISMQKTTGTSGEMQKNPSHCSTLSQVHAARSVWFPHSIDLRLSTSRVKANCRLFLMAKYIHRPQNICVLMGNVISCGASEKRWTVNDTPATSGVRTKRKLYSIHIADNSGALPSLRIK